MIVHASHADLMMLSRIISKYSRLIIFCPTRISEEEALLLNIILLPDIFIS